MKPKHKPHQLQVWYGCESPGSELGLLGNIEPRLSDASVAFALMGLFSQDVLDELQSYGFDLNTLRFTIDRTPEAIAECEARRGLR